MSRFGTLSIIQLLLVVVKNSWDDLQVFQNMTSKILYDTSVIDGLKAQLSATGACTFSVKVRPSASVTVVKDILDDGTVKIDVAAAPEDGKANEELVRFLASEFGIPRSSVQIVSGATAKRKIVRLVAGSKQ